MYCNKCGELNPEGADYCKKCGTLLAHEIPLVQSPSISAGGLQALGNVHVTSGFSVASLVLGILGFSGICAILAIVFGAIGINQANKRVAGGKGMAVAGVVLGSVWLALEITVIIIFFAIIFSPPGII